MTDRTVGTLTAADLGKHVRIEHEGWVHIGELRSAEHQLGWSPRIPLRTCVVVRYATGASWIKHLDADHTIEFRDEGDE